VYSPALTDFIVMVEGTSYMFVTGPDVVKTVTHETVTSEDLGGATAHATKSGVAHFRAPDDAGALLTLRRLLSFLPQNNTESPPTKTPTDDPNRAEERLNHLVPADPNRPYDVRDVIHLVVDDADLFVVESRSLGDALVGNTRSRELAHHLGLADRATCRIGPGDIIVDQDQRGARVGAGDGARQGRIGRGQLVRGDRCGRRRSGLLRGFR